MNILITGITGFLGRYMTKHLTNTNISTIIGTYVNTNKANKFKIMYPHIKLYKLDLVSDNLHASLSEIVASNRINCIIHSAAVKHLGECNDNPIVALRANSTSVVTIIDVAKTYNIPKLLAIGSIKTNNLDSIYGISKYLMENIVLANGYSVYKGVNFFWSDGSVLDIWYNKMINKETLTLRNPNQIRYFNTIEQITETVCAYVYDDTDNNTNRSKHVQYPKTIYKIRLQDLLDAFIEYFAYDAYIVTDHLCYEKEVDTIDNSIDQSNSINIVPLAKIDIIELIKYFYLNHIMDQASVPNLG